jgi:chemotaxis receptor (MCP) glutamine deamidase CheD
MFPIIVPVIYRAAIKLEFGVKSGKQTREPDPQEPAQPPVEVVPSVDISYLLSEESRIPVIYIADPLEGVPTGFMSPFSAIRRTADDEIIGYIEYYSWIFGGQVKGGLNIYNGEGNMIGRLYEGANLISNSSQIEGDILSPDGQIIGSIRGEKILDHSGEEFASFSYNALRRAGFDGVWGRVQDGRITAIEGDPLEFFWDKVGIEKPPPLPSPSGDMPQERITIQQGEYGVAVRGEDNIIATSHVGDCICVSFFDPVSGVGSLVHFDQIRFPELSRSLDAILEHFSQRDIPLSRLRVQLAGGLKHNLSSRRLAAGLLQELNTRGLNIEGAELFPSNPLNIWLDLSDGNLRTSIHNGSMPLLNEAESDYLYRYEGILFNPDNPDFSSMIHQHQE